MSLPFSLGARRKLGANSKLELELRSPKKGRDHSLTQSTVHGAERLELWEEVWGGFTDGAN